MGQITRYNATQSDAALFAHTAGREIENYLPHAVQQLYEYSNQELKALALDTIACHSYLENHFIDKDVFVEKDGQKKAKGRSKWGTKNKSAL